MPRHRNRCYRCGMKALSSPSSSSTRRRRVVGVVVGLVVVVAVFDAASTSAYRDEPKQWRIGGVVARVRHHCFTLASSLCLRVLRLQRRLAGASTHEQETTTPSRISSLLCSVVGLRPRAELRLCRFLEGIVSGSAPSRKEPPRSGFVDYFWHGGRGVGRALCLSHRSF